MGPRAAGRTPTPLEDAFEEIERRTEDPPVKFTLGDLVDAIREDRDGADSQVLIVVDASILAQALVPNEQGDAVRRRLIELVADDELCIVENFTRLEVTSAFRKMTDRGLVTDDQAERMLRTLPQLPGRRVVLTETMWARVWELKGNHTPYDAAYIAVTEELTAENPAGGALLTADRGLAGSPRATCQVIHYLLEG